MEEKIQLILQLDTFDSLIKNKIIEYVKTKKKVRCNCADPFYDYYSHDDWSAAFGSHYEDHLKNNEEPVWFDSRINKN